MDTTDVIENPSSLSQSKLLIKAFLVAIVVSIICGGLVSGLMISNFQNTNAKNNDDNQQFTAGNLVPQALPSSDACNEIGEAIQRVPGSCGVSGCGAGYRYIWNCVPNQCIWGYTDSAGTTISPCVGTPLGPTAYIISYIMDSIPIVKGTCELDSACTNVDDGSSSGSGYPDGSGSTEGESPAKETNYEVMAGSKLKLIPAADTYAVNTLASFQIEAKNIPASSGLRELRVRVIWKAAEFSSSNSAFVITNSLFKAKNTEEACATSELKPGMACRKLTLVRKDGGIISGTPGTIANINLTTRKVLDKARVTLSLPNLNANYNTRIHTYGLNPSNAKSLRFEKVRNAYITVVNRVSSSRTMLN